MRYDRVKNFKQPPHPKDIKLNGSLIKLEPINVDIHAVDLYEAYSLDVYGEIWKYLPFGSFENFEDFYIWLSDKIAKNETCNFFYC